MHLVALDGMLMDSKFELEYILNIVFSITNNTRSEPYNSLHSEIS